ncbi:DUF885 family protein [Pantoea ananatis]|uniref:DUF885 family protein n=1 Tax=Pantoea ananas TaxID=553 RepID=UPI0039B8DCC4
MIDTGIHHKGWTRAQAQAYLRERTALSEHEVTTEVDRYISWPGQALSYKLGELHDAVLQQGSVPLPVLQQRSAGRRPAATARRPPQPAPRRRSRAGGAAAASPPPANTVATSGCADGLFQRQLHRQRRP